LFQTQNLTISHSFKFQEIITDQSIFTLNGHLAILSQDLSIIIGNSTPYFSKLFATSSHKYLLYALTTDSQLIRPSITHLELVTFNSGPTSSHQKLYKLFTNNLSALKETITIPLSIILSQLKIKQSLKLKLSPAFHHHIKISGLNE